MVRARSPEGLGTTGTSPSPLSTRTDPRVRMISIFRGWKKYYLNIPISFVDIALPLAIY